MNNDEPKYKIQIFGQAFVYQKRQTEKVSLEKSPMGVDMITRNKYDEFPCEQLAVQYKGLYPNEKELDFLLRELCLAIKKTMMDKGLVR